MTFEAEITVFRIDTDAAGKVSPVPFLETELLDGQPAVPHVYGDEHGVGSGYCEPNVRVALRVVYGLFRCSEVRGELADR